MSEETREIKLKSDRASGAYGIGTSSLEAEAGKTLTVSRKDARIAVAGGNFEYVEAVQAPTKAQLLKMKKTVLVKIAVEEHGAAQYVERLTISQLADYISTPAMRAEFEAEEEQRKQAELSKIAESGAGEGENDANQ